MKAKSENQKAAKPSPGLKDLTAKSNPRGGTVAAKKTPSGTGTGSGAGKIHY